ncbi:hypothetical protein [Elizabethkingia anophelis]|uniref:hypothetical protein n=1 Tax=Elizabethkingia anophelis TaxID=1117645 RepID=UPI003787014C
MEEKRVFGFSELKYNTESDCKDVEITHSMAFQCELIPYPDNSHLVNMFGGTPAKKESFLSKYKKGKRPQGKHRSKLISYINFKVIQADPLLLLDYKGERFNEYEALQFKRSKL